MTTFKTLKSASGASKSLIFLFIIKILIPDYFAVKEFFVQVKCQQKKCQSKPEYSQISLRQIPLGPEPERERERERCPNVEDSVTVKISDWRATSGVHLTLVLV